LTLSLVSPLVFSPVPIQAKVWISPAISYMLWMLVD
jgi:hypothetical protein